MGHPWCNLNEVGGFCEWYPCKDATASSGSISKTCEDINIEFPWCTKDVVGG